MGIIFFGDRDRFCVLGEKRFDEDAIREVVQATDIQALLRKIPDCHTIVTTGEKASSLVAEWLGCKVPAVGAFVDTTDLRFWRMPSTSRAYPLPLEKKAEEYRKLFH